MMHGRALGASLLLVASCVLARPVQAFSDPASFGLGPYAAGGGGRFFTGSPADGFTCKVCHEGGPEPKLSVAGVPLTSYRPGAQYEIVVIWPLTVEKFAAVVELTDLQGRVAGSVRLPPASEIQAPEFCAPASDAILAATLQDVPLGRQVINVPDCGSQRLRFLWTAPTADVGPVWFAGSSVWSDGEGDVYHDGVTDFGHVIASPSSSALASSTSAGCSLLAASPHGHSACCVLGLLGASAWLRRTRRRRERRVRDYQ
jgi:hypothetical protein